MTGRCKSLLIFNKVRHTNVQECWAVPSKSPQNHFEFIDLLKQSSQMPRIIRCLYPNLWECSRIPPGSLKSFKTIRSIHFNEVWNAFERQESLNDPKESFQIQRDFLLDWKLSPLVFYRWLRLQNATWLSFQPNWKLSPLVFYNWLRLQNTTRLSFQRNWKLSPLVFYHWLRLRNTTWLNFQPNNSRIRRAENPKVLRKSRLLSKKIKWLRIPGNGSESRISHSQTNTKMKLNILKNGTGAQK